MSTEDTWDDCIELPPKHRLPFRTVHIEAKYSPFPTEVTMILNRGAADELRIGNKTLAQTILPGLLIMETWRVLDLHKHLAAGRLWETFEPKPRCPICHVGPEENPEEFPPGLASHTALKFAQRLLRHLASQEPSEKADAGV